MLLACVLGSATIAGARPVPVQTDQALGFFHEPRTVVLERVRRVGLIPAVLPQEFRDREDVRTVLEPLAAQILRQAGFEVVGSADYRAALARFGRQLGGLYDPRTGRERTGQLRTAEQYARREMIEKNRLDGYVLLTIKRTTALLDGGMAAWDGVRERGDGRAAPVPFMHRVREDATGRLDAYSLLLQILNTEGEVVFGRFGGVQLASYFDQQVNAFDALHVIVTGNLLRDPKRLERALNVAALPLLHSAEEIAAAQKTRSLYPALDLPPPPDPGAAPTELRVPRQEILARVHRVVLSEIGTGGFPLPAATAARYRALLRSELARLGWEIIDGEPWGALNKALQSSPGTYDPLTGEQDANRAQSLRKGVFTQIAVSARADVIAWVRLVRTTAEVDNTVGHWDGVSTGPRLGAPPPPPGSPEFDGKTTVQAVSLEVQLIDAENRVLYSGRGGVDVLQHLTGTGDRIDLTSADLFQDPVREPFTAHVALRELVLTPEQIDFELHGFPVKCSLFRGCRRVLPPKQ